MKPLLLAKKGEIMIVGAKVLVTVTTVLGVAEGLFGVIGKVAELKRIKEEETKIKDLCAMKVGDRILVRRYAKDGVEIWEDPYYKDREV